MITVFTPTYNRAYSLPNLYDSLCKQSFVDFEWLLIDDGSTDNTQELIKQWELERKIKIRYLFQPNSGKHVAINKGVKEAKGEIFFIVDSDDYIISDGLKKINAIFRDISDDDDFAGISGIKVQVNGDSVSTGWKETIIDTNALDIRYKYGITGDLAEVFKTKILEKYPFPVVVGERFCTEALVWNRIALKYKLRYTQEPLYVCEYRADGLTANSIRIRRKSPQCTALFYSELSHMPIPLLQKLKAQINYWRFTHDISLTRIKELKMNMFLSLLMSPLGLILRLKDQNNL